MSFDAALADYSVCALATSVSVEDAVALIEFIDDAVALITFVEDAVASEFVVVAVAFKFSIEFSKSAKFSDIFLLVSLI